jgi:hypothetical protein
MKGWIRRTWTGCVVAMALGGTWAHASGSGTIGFVGAIVVPTCNVVDSAAGGLPAGGYQRCTAASGPASVPVSSYRQDVVSLETAVQGHDRLLAYFAGYASAQDTQIFTRTYE